MQDRLSLMLDCMMLAVDEGHSYDGIVSLPEIGLEDFGHRPGLAGSLDDCVELFRTIIAALSGLFRKIPPSINDDNISACDSGIGSGGTHPGGGLVTPPDPRPSQTGDESSQGKVQEVQVQPDPDATDKGRGEQNLGDSACEEDQETCPQERLPRKKDEQLQVGERLPRKRDERVPDDDQSLPSEQQNPEDIASPNIDQSLTTPGDEEGVNRSSNMQQERDPRKKA